MTNSKKIISVVIALVMLLSCFAVPVSALTYNPTNTTGEVKIVASADKTTVAAGDVVTITLSINKGSVGGLGAFGVPLVYNKAQLTPVGSGASFRTWLGDCANFANPNATVNMNYNAANALAAALTTEEKAYYTGGIMVLGTTLLGATARWNPVDTEAFMSFQMTVSDSVKANDEIWVGFHQAVITRNQGYFAEGTTRIPVANFDVSNSMVKLTVKGCDVHTWNEGEVTTAPTCGDAGKMLRTCTVCGATETAEIAATGKHTEAEPVVENEAPASCNTAGSYDSVVYCSVCEAEISRETIPVESTGEHVYATETDRKDATCTEDGYVVMACNCGATETTTLPATGHAWDAGVVTEPTETSEGYTTYTCTGCGATKQENVVPPLTPDTSVAFAIREPSVTKLRFMDEMLLHTDVADNAPEGSYVIWEATEGAGFFKIMEDNGDGKLRITPKNEGWTTFKATLCDADGNVLATDEVEMFSRAHLFDKIGGIFRYIFGSNIKYEK